MNMFSCKEVKEVVISLMGEQKVKDKIYVAGGIVPWILSGNDSGRKHGDIDIVVEKDDMGTVREFLRDKGYYKVEFDSMREIEIHYLQCQLILKIAKKIKLMMSSLEEYIGHDLMVEANFQYDQPQQMVFAEIQQYLNLMATSDAVEQITNP